MAGRLQQLGFHTTVKYDLSHDEFVEALSTFQNGIAPGGIALFYYSGHGAQLSGTNYLIPVNMQAGASAIAVQGSGVSLALVRSALSSAKLSLIVLDACRTIPSFPAKGQAEGLAPFFSRGVLVAYAADEGQAASDNDSEDTSLFTKHLLNELEKTDETLCQLFARVREAVDLASQHVQFPFVYDGVIGDFIFNRKNNPEAQKVASVSIREGYVKAWDNIKTSNDPNDFVGFLAVSNVTDDGESRKLYSLADERLSSLMSSAAKAVGVVPVDIQSPPEVVYKANQAERLFYEKQYSKSLYLYDKLLEQFPRDVSVIHNYATCLLYVGKYKDAIDAFSEAVRQKPEFPWAYYNRGVAYHLQGDLAEAISDYRRTLTLSPYYGAGYNTLAIAKRDQGDLPGAEADVKRAIALDPQYAPAYFNSAVIAARLGDSKTASNEKSTGMQLAIPEPRFVVAEGPPHVPKNN